MEAVMTMMPLGLPITTRNQEARVGPPLELPERACPVDSLIFDF